MLINNDKYEALLSEGLLLDHYHTLCLIRDGVELIKSKRMQGFINLLNKKGFIEDGVLTEKAIKMIDDPEAVAASKPKKVARVVTKAGVNYADWVLELHTKLKERLKERTGKPQSMAIVNGVKYPFLANSTDLGKKILEFISSYKVSDLPKIEKFLLAYVDKCAREKNWTPLLKYYILKAGAGSGLMTAMEGEEEPEETQDDGVVNI